MKDVGELVYMDICNFI